MSLASLAKTYTRCLELIESITRHELLRMRKVLRLSYRDRQVHQAISVLKWLRSAERLLGPCHAVLIRLPCACYLKLIKRVPSFASSKVTAKITVSWLHHSSLFQVDSAKHGGAACVQDHVQFHLLSHCGLNKINLISLSEVNRLRYSG